MCLENSYFNLLGVIVIFFFNHLLEKSTHTNKILFTLQYQDAVRAICNEIEALVKKCGKPKMLDAVKLPPSELYKLVEVCFYVSFLSENTFASGIFLNC